LYADERLRYGSDVEPKEQVLEERVGALGTKVDDGFGRVDADIRELRSRFDRWMITLMATVVGAAILDHLF